MCVLKYIKIKQFVFLVLLSIAFVSCEKDADGTNFSSAGNLQVSKIDPDSASGGTVLYLKGSGLGAIRSIVFEKDSVPAPFNPVFNNDNLVVFRVPDTASGGQQNIVFTNADGKRATVSFKVIALATVSSASSTDFQEGTEITLVGNNLESVQKVTLSGTTAEATIISKEKKKLVIKMPATTASTTNLVITNASGISTTGLTFVNVDVAYALFKDALNADIDNWSWSTSVNPSTSTSILGSSSMELEYTGSWGGLQLHPKTTLSLAPYKKVAFWIKGADTERKISFGLNWANMQTLTIPAKVWTYFSFELDAFKNAGVSNLDTFIMQINGDPDTFYLDNIIFIK